MRQIGWRTLAGAVIAGQPRITEVKGIALEAPFGAATLYINNSDEPGFIGVLGTLVSDLLLLWLDPRIRLEGGSR